MKIFNLFTRSQGSIKDDVLSGLTVALALVPEAVAFSFVAGIDPLVGLYGAFMVGLVTAVLGGRPGMISGATGALAVVMVSLVSQGEELGDGLGLQYLFATLILMGIIQISAGALKLGKFIRLIPHSVMMGFVNGLAIVIFLSQMGMFMEKVDGESVYMHGGNLWKMIGLVALTMGIMVGLPKLTKKVPAALTAIVVVSCIVIFGNMEGVSTVGSFIRDGGGTGLKGGLPEFNAPIIPLDWATLKFIFPYAFILAMIGLIESLMTLSLIDEITETRGNSNRECIAQGTANIVNGFFGGMGGCAMIGQSIININSGGRGRLSGITAALTLLGFILFASPLIEQVPIGALVGVMFMVVIGTFAWSSFRVITKIPVTDAFVIVLVSGLTVIFDLAIAVMAGIVVSAMVFAWENALRIRARKSEMEDGSRLYEIYGPLFFGSTQLFLSKFNPKEDPDKVIIDFYESRISDHSGIQAVQNLMEKYEKQGKKLMLRHLSMDCQRLLKRSNPKLEEIIIVSDNDPEYFVVTD